MKYVSFLLLIIITTAVGMDRPPKPSTWQRIKGVMIGDKSIFAAAAKGDLKTIQKMIDKKENLNQVDDSGNTVLMIAAGHGHTQIVEALIKAGANLNAKNNADQNAIFEAVERGNTDIVAALLKAGVSANQREIAGLGGGRTLLMIATQKNNPTMVRLLVEAGADTQERRLGLMRAQRTTAGEMASENADKEVKAYTQLKKEKIP